MTLAVYDTMVFFQWATLPPEQPHRQHATVTALVNKSVRLCLSPELIFEVRNVLLRPELQAKYKTLTPAHVAEILSQARRFADWFEKVPRHFTLPGHPKDDHILNLAIESKLNIWSPGKLGFWRLHPTPPPTRISFGNSLRN